MTTETSAASVSGSPWRRAIERVTAAAIDHPWLFLAVAALLTAGSVRLASGLEIRSSFEELLPSDVPSVAHIKEMIRRVGGDGSVLVVLENHSPEGLAASKKLAPKLVEEFTAMGDKDVRSVQWNVLAIEHWFQDHWPLFVPLEDLTKARDAVRAEVKKRVTDANPLAVSLDDDDAPAPKAADPAGGAKDDDAVAKWLDPKAKLPRELVAERFSQYDDGFLVNPKKTALTLNVRPAGTSLGVVEARALLDRMQKIVDRHQPELDAAGLRVGFGGSTAVFIDEYEAITGDVFGTAALCFSLVILSILLFYREVRSTAALGISILIAVAITFGLTKLVIGYLNTQTAFLGVIVAGNGINYGLIYLARVQQLRRSGVALRAACIEGAVTCAQATLLASATTSVTFGVLIIAANRGFRHFGFIGAVGMLLCWLCTFAFVPAILAVYEKVAPFRLKQRPAEEIVRVPAWLAKAFAQPQAISIGVGALTVISIALFAWSIPHAMERNLDNLGNDPLGGKVHKDNDLGQSSLGKSIAGTVALLESRAEADEFCDQIRQRTKLPSTVRGAQANSELIDGCETISAIVPRFQQEKLAVIREIQAELGDRLLSHLTPEQAARMRSVRNDLAAQKEVSPADAPPTLIDPFRERDGQVGRLAVVTAKPRAELELGPNLKAFVAVVRDVPVNGRMIEASGSNVIFNDLLDNIDREGPRTTVLSFVGVCLLVLSYFGRKNFRTALEVIITLVVGVALMAGVATLLGMKINFFNFIVFPTTFGIAVDYGANVAARAHERGGRSLLALAEVGPAVALCSWTTIIGYASLLVSINRALRSFGHYGMLGELMSILAALVLLPALLLIAQRRRESLTAAATEEA